MTPQSVLVYAPSWVGDAVMSLGAIRALRSSFPTGRLSVLARPWVRELYDACEAVDDTLTYDPRGEDRGLRGFYRAAERVRREGYDSGVLLPSAFRAACFFAAARIPERWGYATESRALLLTRSVAQAPKPFGRHQAYFYTDMLTELGLDSVADPPNLHLDVPEPLRARARDLLARAGVGGTGVSLVGVHPGATNSRAKLWSPARYAEVATKAARDQDARVVVLGGPSEEALSREVLGALPDGLGVSLQGKTSLGELMGVIGELNLLLTNDSGPMHLGAALGVPTVAVFGPTDARETGPFSARASVVREPVECSPCVYRDCPIDHRCMERVSAERVYEEALALLARATS